MGLPSPVIIIKSASSADPVVAFIDSCYERLSALPNFSVRSGQKDFSLSIARAFIAGNPIAGEAPTGTGKTIAYLVGAIAAAERLRPLKDVSVVIATATVGLQAQIAEGDLPRLYAAGIISPGQVALAKGRGRYFCPQSAERLIEGKQSAIQEDFFDVEQNEETVRINAIQDLLNLWSNNRWAGDVDSLPKATSVEWYTVAADSASCSNSKCEHYNDCPFFTARRTLGTANIVVANQNLVLSDLMAAKEGQDSMFPGNKLFIVFDEAHHLPSKALEVGTAELDISGLLSELPKAQGITARVGKNPDMLNLMAKARLTPKKFETTTLEASLSSINKALRRLPVDLDSGMYRFKGGDLPAQLTLSLGKCISQCEKLKDNTMTLLQALKTTTLPEKKPVTKPIIADLLFQATRLSSKLANMEKALYLLTANKRCVRWAKVFGGKVSLHTSPLEGGVVLQDLLWARSDKISVAMVSATLQDFDGFDRYKQKVGSPEGFETTALPHIFPYHENKLYLVNMKNSPRQDERPAFEEELLEALPKFVNPGEGTLVLVTSKVLMARVVAALRSKFGSKVLAQGDCGHDELIAAHKKKIDNKEGSVICGLATMAEGLDLPGEYCTHVVICTLPFMVPNHPVEQELQEAMGAEYFSKRAMPDTLVRLIQMVGRLMRRETDRGRITVFDKRLHSSTWGRKLLRALPPFKQINVKPDTPPLYAIKGG